MQPLKVIITLLVLIILVIVVGSNLSPMMTVVVLNQPTVRLPIGVWFIIAIGLGLLSSSLIQLLLFLQRRHLTKRIRQLQTRLQQQGEDVFTYTSPAETKEPSREDRSNNYRSNSTNNNFTPPTPTNPIAVDDSDDWEHEPVSNPQVDWDDLPPEPRQQQTVQSSQERVYNAPRTQTIDRVGSNLQPEAQRRGEVYDADFRLIQPPYQEPSADEFEYAEVDEDDEDFEYIEGDEDDRVEDEDFGRSFVEPIPSKRSNRQSDLEEDDWGFEFDDEAEEIPNSKSKNRKF